jgi:hypothetical protein
MVTCITHTIIQGDTLQRLAVVYHVESWQNIVYMNDLVYPFIIDDIPATEDRLPNIKYIGDTIIIPANGVADLNYVSNLELQRRTFGCDIKLNLETQLNDIQNLESQGQMDVNALLDLQLAEGVENLKQSLIRRLTTRLGELPLHPDYGSKFLDMLGCKKTYSNLVKMRLEVQETFLKDTRVSEIKNCKAVTVGKGVLITCDIITVNPQATVPFSTDTNTWEV